MPDPLKIAILALTCTLAVTVTFMEIISLIGEP